MAKTAAPTNVERWFPSKRYVQMIATRKKCSLKYHQRLVYSFLVYRLRKDQTATKVKISTVLRVDKTAVMNALSALTTLGLVIEEQGQYRAAEPKDTLKEWFASNKRTDVPWNRQFATYPVLRPKKGSGLPTKTNAILWLLYSLAPKYGKPVVLGQHLAGLAVMLKMSEKAVKQGVARLIKHGLVEQAGTMFLLKQPTAESFALWEDRPVRQETAFKLAGVLKLRLTNCGENDPEAARKRDDLRSINDMLDQHGLMMQKADCPTGDIVEFWRYVTKHTNLDELWEHAVNFNMWFEDVQEQHHANGYLGSPMTLLWLKVKKLLPEYDPSTY